MSSFVQLVQGAVQAVVIHSLTSYSWFGRVVHQVPVRLERKMAPETARAYLRHSMQLHLYENFYCRGEAAPARDPNSRPAMRPFTPFVQALSASNAGGGTREPGWQVRGVEARAVVVERDGLSLWVPPEDTWPRARGVADAGTTVSVSLPKELLHLSPGFYMALGNRWLETGPGPGILRFYWHVRSEGAAALVAGATASLNRARLPFRLKVVNEPERYARCDAGVLYAHKRDFGPLSRLLADVYDGVSSYLEPATPAFTRHLASGLGLAEDPGDGDSFGMNRCGLLAEGLIRAYEEAKESVAERMTAVEHCFERAGINLAAPFLNPGSSDRYVFHTR
jgi:HopA1 effector protein family